MIDFNNASFVKLKKVDDDNLLKSVQPIFLEGEEVIGVFQAMRDGVVFTNKRIISVNVQGITGKKKDFTSLPYSKIQLFSVETSGHFDLDSELDLWFSGAGRVKFEFTGNTDITQLCKLIGNYVL